MVNIKNLKIPKSLGIGSIGNIAISENIIYLCNKDGLQKKIFQIDITGSYIGYIKTDIPISKFTYNNLDKTFYIHYSNSYSKNTFIHILDIKGTLVDTIDYSTIIPMDILYKESQPWNIQDISIDTIANELLIIFEKSTNIYRISLSKKFIGICNFKCNDLNTNKIEHTISIDHNSTIWITCINNSQNIWLANMDKNGSIKQTIDTHIKSSTNIISGIAIDSKNFPNKHILWLMNTDLLNSNLKELFPFDLSSFYMENNNYIIDNSLNKIINNITPIKNGIHQMLKIENELIKKSLSMNLNDEKLLQVNASVITTINKLSTLENVINSKFHKINLE